MKSFKAIQTNLKRPVICKIVSCSHDYNATSTFFAVFSDNGKSNENCIIAANDAIINDKKTPFFFRLADADLNLKIGDIVLLNPSGVGTFLFEFNSTANSVFLTNRCNSRCIMCSQPPNPDDDNYIGLSLETISLLDPGTKVLGITGGEPTLVLDGLIEVLSACNNYIPSAEIQLLTNARILCDYDKAKKLADAGRNKLLLCVPLYADVDLIHDEIVNAKGAFWETIEGIYNLERLKIPVEIRNVIIKQNYHRLESWSEFIYRGFPFASHLAIMGLEPLGLALKNLTKVWIDPSDYMPFLLKSVKHLNQRDMNISIYNHQLCTMPQELWPFARKSISEWKNVFFDECSDCDVKKDCGGFFQSAENIKSRGINKITA